MRKVFLLVLCLMLAAGIIMNQSHSSFAETKENNVLLIYSMNDIGQIKELRILETLIGQFRDSYTVIKDEDLQQYDLKSYKYIIYLGAEKKKLPENVKNAMNKFEGKIYAIGHNVEQLEKKLPWVRVKGEALVNKVEMPNINLLQDLPEDRIVYDIDSGDAKVLLNGQEKSNKIIPLIMQSDGNFFFAGQNLYDPFGEAITESFREFLNDNSSELIRYLRLEDVHPMVDPDQLKEQADYLKEKNIPYMVAVIPVYSNKGKTRHLSDSPKLVKTLKYMQDNGASIVMHGYRHQYRGSETGEGFEFWDIENDRPIYQPADEKAKLREDFSSDLEFDSFLDQGVNYEKSYIENAINNGVQELVAHGLYPLAFEAPHYAISQQGYSIVSQHFSSYIGRLQLDDLTYQSEYTPMIESRPVFLHGMTLYPETLGYIVQGDENSLERIKEAIEDRENYNKSYLSVFYHPYLGLEGLKEVVDSLEQVKGATWLDLKKRDNLVQVKNIRIESKDGKINIKKPFISSEYERKLLIKKSILWLIPIAIALVAAILFLIRKSKNKRIGSNLK